MKSQIEKILFNIRHNETYSYKEATEAILKLFEEAIGEDEKRTKEDMMLKIVEFENAYKADGWFRGFNQAKQEIRERLGER